MIKSTQETFPSLDIMLYAHDGRGLGHISRSVAIGLAVRRLFPHLRLLLLTGGAQTQELIGPGTLDWLKLPAYRTEVVAGKSRGIAGTSGYSDQELGLLRSDHICRVLRCYQPRIVLVDHAPQGKHKELLPSLQDTEIIKNSRWILGIRGVVGAVKQTASSLAVDLFNRYYSGLLWYGDSAILGTSHREDLERQYSTTARECGYVSRLTEIEHAGSSRLSESPRYCCTVSVPWAGERSEMFLELLAAFLRTAGCRHGKFNLFVGSDIASRVIEKFQTLECCTVHPFGGNYLEVLKCSRTAVIYGGYNSLVDVIAAGLPALVVMRDMQDREQQQHLQALAGALPDWLSPVDEQDCLNSPSLLAAKLSRLLAADRPGRSGGPAITLSGAEHAARYLVSCLG
ncbi:MAG: hypothetical protein V2I35_04735 [Desulfocapsaceae bacterium]|jgi:predicted glycosyltransferase|nr:hypothetical protein [Desulfocapsaceae bacterium]